MATTLTVCAIYARKSQDDSDRNEDARSTTRQIERAREFAASKRWLVDDEHIYLDDGISGAEFAKRPGFLRLMNSLDPKGRRTPFQALIMSEDSRLGREQIETAYALKQLSQAGVAVWSYLTKEQRRLETPTDKMMAALAGFGAETEREKAAQRTRDALERKARAGLVTGGRVFAYDNVRTARGVERRVNDIEAAVVRRLFEAYVRGRGFRAIAYMLNDEGAPCPRTTQGRPQGWSASAVRSILYNPLYRGEVIWGRTKKRDAWGQKKQSQRPVDDWTRVSVPELRVVTDELWDAAHERLQHAREVYLRDTGGKLWGKPTNGIESKYLLTGLSRCGLCGGAFTVRSRGHGSVAQRAQGRGQRVLVYQCLAYVQRGPKVCENRTAIPLEEADAAVLDLVADTVLRDDVVEATLDEALTRLQAPAGEEAAERERLAADLARIEGERKRLTDAIAYGGDLPTLVEAVKQREQEGERLRRALAAVEHLANVARVDAGAIRREIASLLDDWRRLLGGHVQQARQILTKLLETPLRFTPQGKGYVFEGEGRLEPVLTGTVLPKALVAPTGFEPVFQP